MRQIKKEELKPQIYASQKSLLLGVTKKGEIVHFNQGCEQQTGLCRDEVLGKKIVEVLIPEPYRHQWETILQYITSGEEIDDFVMPWVTSNGEETVILWSYLTQNDTDDAKKKNNIYFTGKQIIGYEPVVCVPPVPKFREDHVNKKTTEKHVPHINGDDDILIFNFGDKRIKLRKHPPVKQDSTRDEPPLRQVDEMKKTKFQKSLDTNQEETPQQNTSLPEVSPIDSSPLPEPNTKRQMINTKKGLRFPPLSAKQTTKQEEYKRQMSDLEERHRLLQSYETQLREEKKRLDAQKKSFQKWKEKLEQLENEIEKRRIELVREEKAFRDRLFASSSPATKTEEKTPEIEDYHAVLDKITESAVVLQRGLVKQANQPFSTLLEYSSDEILDKRFYDFIDPEHFGALEQYLLNRLKGEESSSYDTVLCTKTKQKIPATVRVKTTLHHGERAELVIISTTHIK